MRNPTSFTLISAALATAAAASTMSCSTLECGEGTIERDGTCVSGTGFNDTTCGPGTALGPNGTCLPDPMIVCDPMTTQEVVDPDTGVTQCVGTDVGGDCSAPRACPAPQSGKLTLCGRLYDTETDQPIEAANATGELCTASTATGPCSLKLLFFDALEFSINPMTANPIVPTTLDVDDCGRFVAQNLSRPSFGFIGAGTDDANGQPDRYVLTGVATPNASATPARDFRIYATLKSTDADWSSSAAIGGASFAERGVLAAVFRHRGAPVAGVRVRRSANFIPNDDFYFSDTGVGRTTVSPHVNNDTSPGVGSTGPNGTALVINVSSATNHDGSGGEPANCRWPESLAAAIPTVVFVQLKDAETSGGAACP
jgi:hypothetical protein